MGFISKFAQLDKKFAWSFLGFLLAAIFGGIAIYTEFVRDASPIIKYEVLSNTKILDVKEDVGGLSIIYNKEDIRKSKKTLSVLVIKVGNEGRSAVLKGYYDPGAPLGLVVNAGEIIKGEVTSASTPYLSENAKLDISNGNTVHFSDVIIEPNESLVIKFLILNPENTVLTVSPIGKVANVKKIQLIDQLGDQKSESFFARVASGSIWVQIVRVPFYFLGFIGMLLIVFAPIAFIADKVDTRRKGKIIKQFQTYTKNKYDESNSKVYEYYREKGLRSLAHMKKAVSDNQAFLAFLESYKKDGIDFDKIEAFPQDDSLHYVVGDPHGPKIARRPKAPAAVILKNLIELGLVTKSATDFLRNEEKISAMNEFIDFVVIKEAKTA